MILVGLLAAASRPAAAADNSFGSITPDGPSVTVSTYLPGDTASVTFDGTAGQRVSLRTDQVLLNGGYTCCVRVHIRDPNDNLVPGSDSGIINGGKFQGPFTLQSSGPHRIVFDPDGSSYGSARLTLWNVPPDPEFTISPGLPPNVTPVTVTTVAPGQKASAVFNGTAGQRVSLRVDQMAFNGYTCCARIHIRDPNDNVVLASDSGYGVGGYFKGPLQLQASGAYRIVVDPDGVAYGSARLTLWDVPPDDVGTIEHGEPPRTLNATSPGTIQPLPSLDRRARRSGPSSTT